MSSAVEGQRGAAGEEVLEARTRRLRGLVVALWPRLKTTRGDAESGRADTVWSLWEGAARRLRDEDVDWLEREWLPSYAGPPISQPGILVEAAKEHRRAVDRGPSTPSAAADDWTPEERAAADWTRDSIRRCEELLDAGDLDAADALAREVRDKTGGEWYRIWRKYRFDPALARAEAEVSP